MDVCSVIVLKNDNATIVSTMNENYSKLTQLARRTLTTLTLFIILGVSSASAQWTVQNVPTNAWFYDVHFYDTNRGMAAGVSELAKTTDGGTTWTVQSTPQWSFGVYVLDPQTVIVVGGSQTNTANIQRTTDFGNSWTTVTTVNSAAFVCVDFNGSSIGIAAGSGGMLYRTTDMGMTWNFVNSGITSGTINGVSITGNTAYFCSDFGVIGRSTDGGLTWTLSNPANDHYSSIDFYHPDTGIVGGSTLAGNLYMTTENAGTNWSTGSFNNAWSANLIDVQRMNANTSYAINDDQYIWRTYTPGVWIPDSVPGLSPSDTLTAVHFPTPTDGWAVGQGIIVHTSTGGSCSPNPRLAQPNVCLGDTVSLLSYSGWNNYIWTDSATNTVLSNQATQVISPTTDMTIFFEASYPNCGIFRDTIYLNLLGCDSVWPGDANSDGIANMFDLLNIGSASGSMGPSRPAASNNWTPQFSLDWGQTFGLVVDYKHADCNGDGQIGFPDTVALSQNYNLTHNKTNGANSDTGVPLYLVPMFDSLMVGDTGYFRIMLGDAASPVQNLHGIVFSFLYDNTLIDTNTVVIDFDTTWIVPNNMNAASMTKDFYYQGQTDAGYTHMNPLTSSGYGQIGGITFVTIDNISGKKENLTKMLNFNIANVLAVDGQFESIDVATSPDSVLVWEIEINLFQPRDDIKIGIYPNPTTGLVRIDAGAHQILNVEVTDLRGRILRQYDQAGTMDLSTLPNGLYMVSVTTESGKSIQKLHIRK